MRVLLLNIQCLWAFYKDFNLNRNTGNKIQRFLCVTLCCPWRAFVVKHLTTKAHKVYTKDG